MNKIISFFLMNQREYKDLIATDYRFNESFRGGKLDRKFLCGFEWKYIKCYRKYQCNAQNIWGIIYKYRLSRLSRRTGINTDINKKIGKGLIIGHWGTIVINNEVEFGEQIFLTHNVTIGRDVRGKRKGVPTIGNRVCIRAGSTVVGNIHIGDDVLIAPNTFVNFDVPSHSIVIGNPATVHYRENATEGHLGILTEEQKDR